MFGIDGGYGKIFVHEDNAKVAVVFVDGSTEKQHRFIHTDRAGVIAAIECLWAYLPDEYTLATYLTTIDIFEGAKLATTPPLEAKAFIRVGVDSDAKDLPLAKLAVAQIADRELTPYGWLERHSPDPTDLAARLTEKRRRKKLLLHVCCGPDAAGVIQQLQKDFDLLLFWYDPNIQPREEHDLRLSAFEKVARIENVPFVNGEYDVDRFYDSIRGLEHTPERGAKCSHCYDLRLERAAIEAKRQGCDLFSTTLAISPHKVQEKLKSFGRLQEKKLGVRYLARNFVKHEGFNDSVAFTREHEIYRQDYCGCYFSLDEGGPAARWLAERVPVARDPKLERPEHLNADLYKEYQSRLAGADPSELKG